MRMYRAGSITIKNIIFDWSGVLSDDVVQVWKTYNCLFEYYKRGTISFDEFRDNFVLPYTIFWDKYLPGKSKKDLLSKFNQFFKEIEPRPKCFENSDTVLSKLKSKGTSMIVLSAHSFAEEEAKSYFHGKDYFKKVFSGVVDKQEVLPDVLAKTNFMPDETAYVGDMIADIKAGKSCDLITIAILTGYQSKKVLETVHPDVIISDLSKLLDVVIPSPNLHRL